MLTFVLLQIHMSTSGVDKQAPKLLHLKPIRLVLSTPWHGIRLTLRSSQALVMIEEFACEYLIHVYVQGCPMSSR